MGSRILLPVLAAVAIVAGFALWALRDDPTAAPSGPSAAVAERPAAPAPAAARLAAPESAPAETQDARRAAPKTKAPPAAPARAAKERAAGSPTRVEGRVVDRAGRAVAGARVVAAKPLAFNLEDGQLQEPPRAEAATDGDGRFSFPVEPGSWLLTVRAAGFAPLARPEVPVPAGETHDLGELALSAGALLAGRVVDAVGAPVPGARLIDASSAGPVFGGEALLGRAREPLAVTAADGTFRVEELACGRWKVRVESDRHPSQVFEGDAQVPGVLVSGLEFRLPAAAEISGRVTGIPADRAGRLAVRARPASQSGLFDVSGRGARTGECAADGTFRIEGLLSDETYDLQVREVQERSLHAFMGGSARSDSVQARSGDRNVELAYTQGAGLSFRVRDARTGEPISDLRVECGLNWPMPVRDEEGRVRKRWDGGDVEVADLFPRRDERFHLIVRATGYETFEREDLLLEAGRVLDLGLVALEPVPVVVVQVRDRRTGEPVPEAEVTLSKVRAPMADGEMSFDVSIGGDEDLPIGDGGRRARTGEDGVAVLNSMEGETCSLRVEGAGYAPHVEGRLFLPKGERVERVVELGPGGRALVTVLDAEGAPKPGVRVEHRSPADEPGVLHLRGMHGAGNMTDARGTVAFEGLQPGLHSFRIQGDGPGGFFGDGEAVVVFAGGGSRDDDTWVEAGVEEGETTAVTLLAAPAGTVEGRVREGGAPLAGATLELRERSDSPAAGLAMAGFPGAGGKRATTDGDGYYAFEGVEPGEYTLEVSHPARVLPAQRELVLEDRAAPRLRFDVDLSVSIVEGRVTDTAGEPLEGIDVWAERVQSAGSVVRSQFVMIQADGDDGDAVTFGGQPAGGRARTGPDGTYRLRGVPEDLEIVVKASSPYHEEGTSSSVRVGPNEVQEGVDLELAGAGKVEVSVVGADGRPSGMCMCVARPAGDPDAEPERQVVGPSGRVVLTGLRPGPWSIGLQSFRSLGGDPAETRTVEVVAGETAQVTLTAP